MFCLYLFSKSPSGQIANKTLFYQREAGIIFPEQQRDGVLDILNNSAVLCRKCVLDIKIMPPSSPSHVYYLIHHSKITGLQGLFPPQHSFICMICSDGCNPVKRGSLNFGATRHLISGQIQFSPISLPRMAAITFFSHSSAFCLLFCTCLCGILLISEFIFPLRFLCAVGVGPLPVTMVSVTGGKDLLTSPLPRSKMMQRKALNLNVVQWFGGNDPQQCPLLLLFSY